MTETTPSDNSGADVVGFPPLVGAALVLLGFLLQLWIPLDIFSTYTPALLIGASVLALGIGLQIACIRAFKRVKTTPLFNKPTATILRSGLYGTSRNPIYVSVLIQFTGLLFLANSYWFLLILPILFLYLHFLVIAREERYLERKFGQEFLDYKQTVPRWF